MSQPPNDPYQQHPQHQGYPGYTGYPQYQGYPQPPGGFARPEMPLPIRRAFQLMFAGAGVKVAAAIASFAVTSDRVVAGLAAVGQGFGALFGVGLWISMAFSIKAGHQWARVVGTVFFGIASLGLLGDVLLTGTQADLSGSQIAVVVGFDLLHWVIGLTVTILIWHRASSAYFQKPAAYPYGYPYYPQQPGAYPQQPYPVVPQSPPQEPANPWDVPPSS